MSRQAHSRWSSVMVACSGCQPCNRGQRKRRGCQWKRLCGSGSIAPPILCRRRQKAGGAGQLRWRPAVRRATKTLCNPCRAPPQWAWHCPRCPPNGRDARGVTTCVLLAACWPAASTATMAARCVHRLAAAKAAKADVLTEAALADVVCSGMQHGMGPILACPYRPGTGRHILAEVASHKSAVDQSIHKSVDLDMVEPQARVSILQHALDSPSGGHLLEVCSTHTERLRWRRGWALGRKRLAAQNALHGSPSSGRRPRCRCCFRGSGRCAATCGQGRAVVPQQFDLHGLRLPIHAAPPLCRSAAAAAARVTREDEAPRQGVEVHLEDRSAGRALRAATQADAASQSPVPATPTIVDRACTWQVDELLVLKADGTKGLLLLLLLLLALLMHIHCRCCRRLRYDTVLLPQCELHGMRMPKPA
mmetsp:Transcript_25429/g.67596  ORF Transcript_25429/g.67596 Transcript_25429/m.67596 type:complete len:420 (-) Transcript_25429:12-1271(-)